MGKKKLNPRALRERKGLSQAAFWTPVGISQSGGSRYESRGRVPPYVERMIRLVHAPADEAMALLAALRGVPATDLCCTRTAAQKGLR